MSQTPFDLAERRELDERLAAALSAESERLAPPSPIIDLDEVRRRGRGARRRVTTVRLAGAAVVAAGLVLGAVTLDRVTERPLNTQPAGGSSAAGAPSAAEPGWFHGVRINRDRYANTAPATSLAQVVCLDGKVVPLDPVGDRNRCDGTGVGISKLTRRDWTTTYPSGPGLTSVGDPAEATATAWWSSSRLGDGTEQSTLRLPVQGVVITAVGTAPEVRRVINSVQVSPSSQDGRILGSDKPVVEAVVTTALGEESGSSTDRALLQSLTEVLAAGTPLAAGATQCYPGEEATVLLDLATAPGWDPVQFPTQEYTYLALDRGGKCPQLRSSAGAVFTVDRARLDPLLQQLFASDR